MQNLYLRTRRLSALAAAPVVLMGALLLAGGALAQPTVTGRAPERRPLVSLTLHAAGAPAVETDEATVFFQEGASARLDERFDGEKPAHNVGVPTLVSLAGADELAVNGLPESALADGLTIPLLADLPAAGTYELAVSRALNLTGTPLVLVDNLTRTRYALDQQPVVRFTATQAGEVKGRFALVIGEQVTPAAVGLTLWPNPTHGMLHVSLPAEAGAVDVLDATGRVVRTVARPPTPAPATVKLDLGGLPAGVYTVRCGALTERLVVE